MLRIAAVTRYFPSSAEPWQGRSAYETLRVIAREAEVRVFYPDARYPRGLKRQGSSLDASFSPPEVQASYFEYPAIPVLSRPFNGRLAARALLAAVRGFAPDLIFGCYLYPDGYAALRIGQALGVPVVAMSIGSDINRIGDRITRIQTCRVLREADFVVTVSNDLRRKAVAMGAHEQQSRAIVNGCDLTVFHPGDRQAARRKLGIEADAEVVVYLGRMDARKGLHELVAAAALLRAERPRLQVYMIGAGPEKGAIESAIKAVSAAGYIHALPACAFDDVAVWMAAADLVTLPSFMEGCPNVVLEAQACGRPVVATNVGGIPEILSEECGRLVAPRDPAALAGALKSVLGRSWDAQAIAERGGRSWERVAAELSEVFAAVVSARKEGA
jgi:glycosyltransferase involved in cell wall biosynthesis